MYGLQVSVGWVTVLMHRVAHVPWFMYMHIHVRSIHMFLNFSPHPPTYRTILTPLQCA